jgi:hypothetical protein
MPLTGVGADIVHPDLPAAINTILTGMMGSGETVGDTITIRRGGTTLSAQTVRIGKPSSVVVTDSEGAEQAAQLVPVIGDTDLDIQKGDRFNDSDGKLYEVTGVRAHTHWAKVAEAEVVSG